ncbi:MAG: helix-turn-helix domain-containing protein [Erysipelotrichaceae bacterium]|jgi:transcriptional regulator with XRE-family HTH domain
MFQENLKALRMKKGMTQQELATRLHIVRQTISKWEKGLSVPDSYLLIRLAEVLEVSVSELLGSKIEIEEKPDVLAQQLSRINEQLAIKNRRAKRVWGIIFGIIIIYVVLIFLAMLFNFYPESSTTTTDTVNLLRRLTLKV